MNRTTLCIGSLSTGLILGLSGSIGGTFGGVIGFLSFLMGAALILTQVSSDMEK